MFKHKCLFITYFIAKFICFNSRKYTTRLQEQEEHIESLVVKVNNLEKQKSRLQSEVEVLIIDLEKVKYYFHFQLFNYIYSYIIVTCFTTLKLVKQSDRKKEEKE